MFQYHPPHPADQTASPTVTPAASPPPLSLSRPRRLTATSMPVGGDHACSHTSAAEQHLSAAIDPSLTERRQTFAAMLAAAAPSAGRLLHRPDLAPHVLQYPDQLICTWEPRDGPARAGLFRRAAPPWMLSRSKLPLVLVLDTEERPLRLGGPSEAMRRKGLPEQYGVWPLVHHAAGAPLGNFEGSELGTFVLHSRAFSAAVAAALAGKPHSHLLTIDAPIAGQVALLDGATSRPGGLHWLNDPTAVPGARVGARRGTSIDGTSLNLFATRHLSPLLPESTEDDAVRLELMWRYGGRFLQDEAARRKAVEPTAAPPTAKRPRPALEPLPLPPAPPPLVRWLERADAIADPALLTPRPGVRTLVFTYALPPPGRL